MTQHLKRFRIEFTVNTYNEGVTMNWDWSNDDIKGFALQELECMSPCPLDITFSEVTDIQPLHDSVDFFERVRTVKEMLAETKEKVK